MYPNQGRYNVVVIANNTAGNCKDTATATVEAYPNPVAMFYTDPTKTTVALPKFKMYNQSTVTASPFNPTMRYLWDFGVPALMDDSSTTKDPRYSYGKDTATYQIMLIVTTDKGCKDTAYKTVFIGPDIIVFIPDVFTPDDAGPNRNNTFNVTALNFKAFNMLVYNRWGEKMYETTDILKGWDGKANGEECMQGVYVYHVEVTSFEDKVYKYYGTITLLR
jgi:gliding motility-associated-like protein